MEDSTQHSFRPRRRAQLAPWERLLRQYWPPVRLALLGAIALSLVVLLISCMVAAA